MEEKRMITSDMIVDTKWFCGRDTIGIVLVKTAHGHKAYIGAGNGFSQDEDSLMIAQNGTKFYPYAAAVWPGIKDWCP